MGVPPAATAPLGRWASRPSQTSHYRHREHCGAVFAEEETATQEVGSQIVGFQHASFAEQAYYMTGSGFMTIAGDAESYSVQSLVPVLPEDAVDPLADGDAVIQLLTPEGEIHISDFIYYLVPGSKKTGFEGAGWYTKSGTTYTKSTKVFTRNEGFIYSSPYACDEDDNDLPTSLRSSGEVKIVAKTLSFGEQAYYALANTRPIDMSVQKLVPTLPEDAVDPLADGDAVIQVLTPEGEIHIADFIYYLVPGSKKTGFEGAGWYTKSGTTYTKATKVFKPGEGFIYSSPYACDEDDNDLPTYLTFEE